MNPYVDLHTNLSLPGINDTAATLLNSSARNDTSEVQHHKSLLYIELISVLYVIGIIGSFSALLHLYRKKSFKNTKQAFMLKCLMTLEFVGLVGMLFTLQMTIRDYSSHLYKSHIGAFCFFRILGRFFGLCSGCVAFLMAIERYFALTKPFWYCKHFTNGLMKRLIIVLWSLAAILSFSPVLGFGTYYDDKAEKCTRYRDATKPLDVTYAFIFFFVGSTLCIFMVICNVSVTRMVYTSYRNMKQLTRSSLENFNRIQAIKFRHQISEVSTSSNSTTKSVSFITRDEIEFINMVNLLTASFVICWGTSMITIPIAQFVKTANHSTAGKIFFKIADTLLLLHFIFDPFVYVFMRTDYWKKIKNFFTNQFCLKEQDEFAEMF